MDEWAINFDDLIKIPAPKRPRTYNSKILKVAVTTEERNGVNFVVVSQDLDGTTQKIYINPQSVSAVVNSLIDSSVDSFRKNLLQNVKT